MDRDLNSYAASQVERRAECACPNMRNHLLEPLLSNTAFVPSFGSNLSNKVQKPSSRLQLELTSDQPPGADASRSSRSVKLGFDTIRIR